MGNKITKGVMKTMEYENMVMYRAMCACSANEHDVTMSFEYDKELNEVELHFFKTISWYHGWNEKWYEKIWRRIKCSSRLLFTGWIDLEDDFLIQDVEVLDNIITAMIDGRVMIRRTQEKERMKEKENKTTVKFPETKEEIFEEIEKGF